MRALYTAATGMAAQELNVQVISNNIANLRTTGYKKQRAAFQDLIYDHVRRVGAQASDQGAAQPDTNSVVRQGFVEKSNVNSVHEMSRMIEITRTYTQISALLQQQHDLHRTAVEKLADVPA